MDGRVPHFFCGIDRGEFRARTLDKKTSSSRQSASDASRISAKTAHAGNNWVSASGSSLRKHSLFFHADFIPALSCVFSLGHRISDSSIHKKAAACDSKKAQRKKEKTLFAEKEKINFRISEPLERVDPQRQPSFQNMGVTTNGSETAYFVLGA